MIHMRCIVCGEALDEYAFIGKKKDVKAAFCARHVPDCDKCDSCDLRCMKCGMDMKLQARARNRPPSV
jgi:hypothetical protein